LTLLFRVSGDRDKSLDIEEALKLAGADDGKISFGEIRQNLKRSNFSDLEIEMFFVKYDKDGDGDDISDLSEVIK